MDGPPSLQEAELWRLIDRSIHGPPSACGTCTEDEQLSSVLPMIVLRRYSWTDRAMAACPPYKETDKADVILALDAMLQRHLLARPFSAVARMLLATISQHCTDRPGVRQQTLALFFQWQISRIQMDPTCMSNMASSSFDAVLSLCLRGLADVWSAIRRQCADSMTTALLYWTNGQVSACYFISCCH